MAASDLNAEKRSSSGFDRQRANGFLRPLLEGKGFHSGI